MRNNRLEKKVIFTTGACVGPSCQWQRPSTLSVRCPSRREIPYREKVTSDMAQSKIADKSSEKTRKVVLKR
ncbi:hypothetical protein OUZ56_028558 [Daphnia magna]|uniref:Uncharacterized protein n=1 Tax=Daphnia magna TaxID=35525 RepID=A0ABR0B477_9CRUS|nr:hypothetical protein OUZ56_028558 [Daphnia magna]